MDETSPLISNSKKETGWFGTRLLIGLFALLCGCARDIQRSTETQFIYAYLKNHTSPEVIASDVNNSVNNKECLVNSTEEAANTIQGLASDWSLYIQLATYVIGLAMLILLGPWTDRIGQKPILVYNTLLTFLSYGTKTYAVYADLNLYWYLLFSAIEGLGGAHYMFSLGCSALLANCTREKKDRSFFLAFLDAMMGIGISGSQIAAGYLIKLTGYTYPFLTASALMLLICLLTFFTLSDVKEQNEKNKTISVQDIFTFCSKPSSFQEGTVKYLIIYYFLFVISIFPSSATGAIRLLYLLGSPFCWLSVHIGWFQAGNSFGELVIGTAILKLLLRCLSVEIITILGLLSAASSYIIYGFSSTDWMIYGAAAVGILRVLPIPLIKATVSHMICEEKQGALFANIYILEAVCRLFGSTVFNNIYHQTRPIFKGMVFFVMASFPIFATGFMLCVSCKQPKTKPKENIINSPSFDTTKYSNSKSQNVS